MNKKVECFDQLTLNLVLQLSNQAEKAENNIFQCGTCRNIKIIVLKICGCIDRKHVWKKQKSDIRGNTYTYQQQNL